jgi:hypothetical protein
MEFHVSLNGNYANAGTQAEPFATMERSSAAVRAWRAKAATSCIAALEAVTVSCKELLHVSCKKEAISPSTIGENLAQNVEVIGFANLDRLDLRIRRDSIVHKKLPAFQPIPFEPIGLKKDEYRTTLPTGIRTPFSRGSKEDSFDSDIDVQQSNQTKR